MTQKQYHNELVNLLTASEFALINPNIYWNTNHTDYYMTYKSGNYAACLQYMKQNKHLLTLEHTPEEHLEMSKQFIENTTEMWHILKNQYK